MIKNSPRLSAVIKAPSVTRKWRWGQPLGMTRGAEFSGAAGKHKKPLLLTVGTPDPGKAAAGIAAVEIALHDLLNDRAEVAVLLLETALILRYEPLEMMEQYPAKDRPLRMSRTIDSRYSGRMASRNGPTSRK